MPTFLAHITVTDVGVGVGLFLLGVLTGVLLAGRLRDAWRPRRP